jgi:hypothetical protein
MLLFKEWFVDRRMGILSADKQIKGWRKANRRMKWGIPAAEFDIIEPPPQLTSKDKEEGFIGTVLNYGFGGDGIGNSDTVLSAQKAWTYARKNLFRKTWQCEYIDFNRTDDIRLRPDAPDRPKGFYYIKFKSANHDQSMTVSQFCKNLKAETGLGPEGIQLLAITHIHFQKLMHNKDIPFMALADFDVAPHGFNDFYDAPQLFCSNETLGLGIGNIDKNYPFFGIPTIRF